MNNTSSLNNFNNNNFNSNVSSTHFTFDSTNQLLTLTGGITPIEIQELQKVASIVKVVYIKTNKAIEELADNVKFDLVDKVNISQCRNIDLSILPDLFPHATHYIMDANMYNTAPHSSFLKWQKVTSLDLEGLDKWADFDHTKIPNLSSLNGIPKENFLSNDHIEVKRFKHEDTPEDTDADIPYTCGVIWLEIDRKKAAECFEEAVALGHAGAMFNLAVLYHEGTGVEKDLGKAFDLYRQAAALGNANALFNLSCCYEKRIGVECHNLNPEVLFKLALQAEKLNKEAEAVELYELAVEYGSVSAAYNLGIYREKHGNIERALELFRLAADKGHQDALDKLILYELRRIFRDSDRVLFLAGALDPEGNLSGLENDSEDSQND